VLAVARRSWDRNASTPACAIAGRAIVPGNGFTRANGYEPLSLAD
jgi:hypothetical protein